MRPTFYALTSVRGLAAWWVVLYHFRELLDLHDMPAIQALANHGYLAVDLFFIMSGFVIALSYSAALQTLRLSGILRFLGFRLARIYPLHLVMLIAFLVNPLAIHTFSRKAETGDRYDPGYYLQSLFLVQNWGFTSLEGWNFPSWSISTEWGAYLLFPALAWYSERFVTHWARAAAVLLLTLAFLAVLGWEAGGLGSDIPHAGLPRCMLEFSMGIMVFRLHAMQGSKGAAGGVLLLAGASILLFSILLNLPDYIFAPFGLLLVVMGLLDEKSVPARILDWKPLLLVGEASYSTYLVHYFVRDWSKFLLLRDGIPTWWVFGTYIIATAAVTPILYRYVELPGRQSGRNVVQNLLARF